MPELLAVGEKGALEVLIPANITFDPGELYQLWLRARNSNGSSEPGAEAEMGGGVRGSHRRPFSYSFTLPNPFRIHRRGQPHQPLGGNRGRGAVLCPWAGSPSDWLWARAAR